MSKENSSIHDFDINLIVDFFSYVERQGPGSPETTIRALSFIDRLSSGSHIADIGCGTGGQTMVLAAHTQAKITGVDLFPVFVNRFNSNAQELNYQHRVKCEVGSMDDLQFKDEELDLIWSEGAIYNIGFEKGLREWGRFLKKDGFIAVSEASWFTEKRPSEIEEYWNEAYPGIDTIANKVSHMQKAGYVPVASFIIPENCWTEHFYKPLGEAKKLFLKKHSGNRMAEDFIRNQNHEEAMYAKYKDYYGYVFYIGKKI